MIIVGYQGIGKSTLAKNSNKYIDLESGNFWIGDERQDDWYKIYCKIATELSRQGYTVFVSSHYVVRKGLRQYSRTEEVKCCFPDISLRDKWIKKLEDRYHNSKLEKDYRAWQHAKDFYVRDIQNLSTDSFESICIKSMDYDLKELIENKEGDNCVSRAYIESIVEELENICINGDEHILLLLSNIKNAPSVTPQTNKSENPTSWIPVTERLPKVYEFVNCTCHSLIDDRDDWVIETVYIPQPSDSPYSDWGNIPMLNSGDCKVVAWMHRDILEPYKAESEENADDK